MLGTSCKQEKNVQKSCFKVLKCLKNGIFGGDKHCATPRKIPEMFMRKKQ